MRLICIRYLLAVTVSIAAIGIGTGISIEMGAISKVSPLPLQQAQAQTTNATATSQVMNLTKYFDEHKEFQSCSTLPNGSPLCIPETRVLYQSAHTLAMKSFYIDAIWKAVDLAKTFGYHVDGITSYTTTTSYGGSVNILVSMSR